MEYKLSNNIYTMTKIMSAASLAAAIAVASSLAIVMPAFAQTGVSVGVGPNISVQGGVHDGANGGVWRGGPGMTPGIFGTVSAVDGDTLTVTSVMRPHPMPMQPVGTPATSAVTSTVVYTVDASNATIYKGSATTTVSVSDIATGDMVIVQGTVSGTNVTATVIRDGVMPGRMMGPGMPGRGFGHGASSTPSGTPILQGNGEPVIGGNVTAISGTTLTVTNEGNVTYTIDAASTTIMKSGTSTAFSNIAVGDNIIVQGVINGNSVTASSIIDQGTRANGSSTNASSSRPKGGIGIGFGGFFGVIGGFFQHIFGF